MVTVAKSCGLLMESLFDETYCNLFEGRWGESHFGLDWFQRALDRLGVELSVVGFAAVFMRIPPRLHRSTLPNLAADEC